MQTYSPIIPSNDPYQDIAFELSLDHGYFEGVVRICHEYNVSRSDFDNDASDDENMSKYDLKAMLSTSTAADVDEANPHAGLYISSDFKTGLSFPKFVLKWYTDRKLFGSVLKLGENCPEILSHYLEEDNRLSALRWIQHVRTDQFENASSCLANLVSGGSTMLGEKADERQTLEDTQLVRPFLCFTFLCEISDSVSEFNLRSLEEALTSEKDDLGDTWIGGSNFSFSVFFLTWQAAYDLSLNVLSSVIIDSGLVCPSE